jgi:hypothetical protein
MRVPETLTCSLRKKGPIAGNFPHRVRQILLKALKTSMFLPQDSRGRPASIDFRKLKCRRSGLLPNRFSCQFNFHEVFVSILIVACFASGRVWLGAVVGRAIEQ